MSHDPVSGPLSREELRELVAAPYGAGLKVLRRYDPMVGRAPGETIKWRVSMYRECIERGWVTVEASSADEAEDIASKLPDAKIEWDDVEPTGEAWIEDVEPAS